MMIRVGIEGGRKPVLARATALNAAILVSANSLWDNRRQVFSGYQCYQGHDTALDSGGFVAMHKYGGYRWSVEQYIGLAKAMAPTWYAQMDFCCEPEIADSQSVVWKRIDMTATHLQACQEFARQAEAPMPMPVLQGWKASDYCQGPIYEQDYPWPSLVGIGSVCRRNVHGADGIMAVVRALDRVLPQHVKLHLFGVKSQAIEELMANFPHRMESMDSMAWNRDARWHAYNTKTPCNGEMRADFMESWYLRQIERTQKQKQLTLL